MNPLILHIETSTGICSVALSQGNKVLSFKSVGDKNVHAELLTVFIEDILGEAGEKLIALDAISVNKGPGSFTGLRIGVAVAKGLCFGLGIPLLSVDGLEALANTVSSESEHLILATTDARNGEIYTAVYDHKMHLIKKADIHKPDFESINKIIGEQKAVVVGDGLQRFGSLMPENWQKMPQILPDSRILIPLATKKFLKQEFEDIVSFEPLYLRDFKAKVGNKIKKILGQ